MINLLLFGLLRGQKTSVAFSDPRMMFLKAGMKIPAYETQIVAGRPENMLAIEKAA
jgi:hypothetical protein